MRGEYQLALTSSGMTVPGLKPWSLAQSAKV